MRTLNTIVIHKRSDEDGRWYVAGGNWLTDEMRCAKAFPARGMKLPTGRKIRVRARFAKRMRSNRPVWSRRRLLRHLELCKRMTPIYDEIEY